MSERRLTPNEELLWAFVVTDKRMQKMAHQPAPQVKFAPRPRSFLGPLSPHHKPDPVLPQSIDLHGLTTDVAFAALCQFIRAAHKATLKQVIVVTGKSGVLRMQVPRWLSYSPIHSLVRHFNPAPPQNGGHGALLVLLQG